MTHIMHLLNTVSVYVYLCTYVIKGYTFVSMSRELLEAVKSPYEAFIPEILIHQQSLLV